MVANLTTAPPKHYITTKKMVANWLLSITAPPQPYFIPKRIVAMAQPLPPLFLPNPIRSQIAVSFPPTLIESLKRLEHSFSSFLSGLGSISIL